MQVKRSKIKKIEQLENLNDQYVYDIGINEKTPYFFGNNILVHNSSYFSVYEAYRNSNDEEKQIMAEKIFEDVELALSLYDDISINTNNTFPEFMSRRFNTGLENGSIIKASRENLADYALFIKKKRYAMHLIEKDGIRLGEKGKLKIMGIEIKRSDTPKIIQNALKEGLDMLLHGKSEKEVMNYFIDFKIKFLDKEPWLMGRPGGANAVTYYSDIYERAMKGEFKKPMIPANIMGAIAWNTYIDFYDEKHIPKIGNGSKVINCKLKKNDFDFNCISYPTDQTQFPDWFKELPFDIDEMIDKIYYKKVNNIFGVLKWDFKILKANTNVYKFFEEDEF